MPEAFELIDAMKKFAVTTWGDSGDAELDAAWELVGSARSLLTRLGGNDPKLLAAVAAFDTFNAESETEEAEEN